MRTRSRFANHLWNAIIDGSSEPFWIDQTHTRTFKTLEEEVCKVTALFQRNEISVGDFALVKNPDDWTTFCFWLACVLNGVIPVVLAPDTGTDRMAAICKTVRPKIIFDGTSHAAESTTASADIVCLNVEQYADFHGSQPPSFTLPDDGTACVVFTSGTTDTPNGVVITHENLSAQLTTIARVFQVDRGSRIYNGLVLYHVDGLFQGPLLALWSRAAVLRPPAFTAPRLAADMEWLAEEHATHMVTAPAFLELMDQMCPRDDYFARTTFVAILSSSAKLSKDLWTRIEARFDVTVVNEYGMTETVAASHFAGDLPEMGARYGIGKPIDCEARLVSRDGIVDGAGQTGELQVRGKNICAGYLGAREREGETIVDGWLRTGDLAIRDSDGNYDIVGRLSTAINFGGFRILPEEIDQVICQHPQVIEAKTIGIDDAVFGQVPFSVFAAEAHVAPDQLLDFCRMQLEARKVPKRVLQVKKLPKTGSDKIDVVATKALILGRFTDRDPAKSLHLDKVMEIAADVFGVSRPALPPDAEQETVPGWDSYAHTVLMLEIEEAFGIEISATEMMETTSLNALRALVARSLGDSDDIRANRVQSVRSGNGQGSLIFVPGIAGRAGYAARLLPHLTERVSVYTASVDPKTAETEAEWSIPEMAEDFASEIASMSLSQPLTLIGNSFGGFLAYEIGAALMRRGLSVNAAILLDTAVPWPYRRLGHVHQLARRTRELKAWGANWGKTKSDVAGNYYEIKDFGRIDLGRYPEKQHATVKQSFRAISKYKPSQTEVPVFVFFASYREKGRIPMEPHLGWGRFSSGHVSSMKLGDAHTSIIRKEDEAKIAAERVNGLLKNDGCS